jgi:predicted phage-related endonuclease
MNVGELITPTGRLVLGPEDLKTEKWLEARRWRGHTIGPHSLGYCIGSSDVPSILDLEHVDTPAHVYRNKVYGIDSPPNAAMNKGTVSEPGIALEWCRRNRAVIDEIGLVAKDGEPWHQSTIDRRVRECPVFPDRKGECGLEVKRMEYASASRWDRDLPDRLIAQLIHQLYVTGYHHMHYMADVPGDFRQGIVYREREQRLMDYVIAEVERFRLEALVKGAEPAWNAEKPDKMIALDNATHPDRSGIAELDTEGIGTVMAYAEAQAESTAVEKRKKQLSAELRRLAPGAEIATFSNERAYWYRQGSKPKVDLQMLKERWPDVYDAVVSETTFPVLHIDKAFKPRGDKG